MKTTLATSVLLCLSVFPALGQDLQRYRRFDDPAKQYIKAAQGKSDELAQFVQKYLSGQGALQNHQEFAEQVSKAAGQGDQWAQLMLGLAYFAGRGVPYDIVQSHMWSNLAGVGSDQYIALLAQQQRDMISGAMSREQIAKAQELARNWSSPRDLEKTAQVTKHTRWAFWRR